MRFPGRRELRIRAPDKRAPTPSRPYVFSMRPPHPQLVRGLLFLAALGGSLGLAPRSLAATRLLSSSPIAPMLVTLFTFDTANEPAWSVVNDGVMGGRSAGFVELKDGALRFTGTLVTQGGGFTLTRAQRRVDLTGSTALELRVRGSGRSFQVELDDGSRGYGRNISRRASFATSAEWTVVRVPISALRSTIFGREVNAPPIALKRIQSIGIYMADGKDGAFWLEVDYIRAVGQ